MRTDNLRHRHFKPLLRAAGLPNVRLYDLRHSFSTLWVESGEDFALLQKILGHTSIRPRQTSTSTSEKPRKSAPWSVSVAIGASPKTRKTLVDVDWVVQTVVFRPTWYAPA